MEEVSTLKYTWKIKDFSILQSRILYSDVFSHGSYKWRMSAYPKGNNVDDYLSIYLDVVDPTTLPSGWSRNVKFSFTIVNQIEKKWSITKVVEEHEFKANHDNLGFPSFISHKELHNLTKGFLVKDTCIIEADVTMYAGKQTRKEESTEDMEAFFVKLKSVVSTDKLLPHEVEATRALEIIDEALNAAPADLNNAGKMCQLKNAFDVLSSLDDGSVLTTEQKAELLSMKQKFTKLPDRAASAVEGMQLFTEKELVKTTLDQKLARCLVEFENAKAEIKQNEQNIAILEKQIGEMKSKKENLNSKKKQMFTQTKEVKAELEVLVKYWPEYEAKMKAAKEEEKEVDAEWSKMKQLFSSLKEQSSLKPM